MKKRQPLKVPAGFTVVSDDDNCQDGSSASGVSSTVFSNLAARIEAVELLKNQGLINAEEGDHQSALNCWRRALNIDSENHVLHELMAQAYLSLDMLVPAVVSAERSVELCSTWSEGLQTLGRCQREMGELGFSLESYRKACALDKDHNTEMIAEYNEVAALCNALTEIRTAKMNAVESSANLAEQEANLCMYHLSARQGTRVAPVLTISVTPTDAAARGDNDTTEILNVSNKMQGLS
jgi:tetratricopeptide (TPR) repeat protein